MFLIVIIHTWTLNENYDHTSCGTLNGVDHNTMLPLGSPLSSFHLCRLLWWMPGTPCDPISNFSLGQLGTRCSWKRMPGYTCGPHPTSSQCESGHCDETQCTLHRDIMQLVLHAQVESHRTIGIFFFCSSLNKVLTINMLSHAVCRPTSSFHWNLNIWDDPRSFSKGLNSKS